VASVSSRHLVILKLLQASFPVYPINSKLSKKWRQCERPQKSATDRSVEEILANNLHPLHEDL